MTVERVYLVISADRQVRAARRPRIQPNEVAIVVNLRFPDTWGKVIGTADFEVPDFAPQVLDDDNGEPPGS